MSTSSAAAAVELDFFRLEKETSAKPPPPSNLFHRRRSFRAISKMNPELLKNVIATASKENTNDLAAPKPSMESTPLTLFYNGTVAVFDVHPLQAENILRLARHQGISQISDSVRVDKLTGDMPLHRRMSLQMFLHKRKERVSPTLIFEGRIVEEMGRQRLKGGQKVLSREKSFPNNTFDGGPSMQACTNQDGARLHRIDVACPTPHASFIFFFFKLFF